MHGDQRLSDGSYLPTVVKELIDDLIVPLLIREYYAKMNLADKPRDMRHCEPTAPAGDKNA